MASTPESTVEELLDEQVDFDQHLRQLSVRRWVRRAVLAVLGLIVALGVAGVFGERTSTVHATAGVGTLDVSYPSLVRDGPPASFEITVERPGGFNSSVDLAFDASYLSALDQVSVSPQPESERTSGDDVVWTFSQPAGDRLVVRIEAQVSSQARFRHRGEVRLLDGGKTVADVRFTTWVWP
jgi:hypothetical protein